MSSNCSFFSLEREGERMGVSHSLHCNRLTRLPSNMRSRTMIDKDDDDGAANFRFKFHTLTPSHCKTATRRASGRGRGRGVIRLRDSNRRQDTNFAQCEQMSGGSAGAGAGGATPNLSGLISSSAAEARRSNRPFCHALAQNERYELQNVQIWCPRFPRSQSQNSLNKGPLGTVNCRPQSA